MLQVLENVNIAFRMAGVGQLGTTERGGFNGAGSAAELANETFRMVAVAEFLLILVLYR